MIAIIDYGMGNIHSVNKALEVCGARTIVTSKPEDIRFCDKLVLPGVGAFADAMAELDRQGLTSLLKEQIKKKKPFLGICLGMHLLFEASQEAERVSGLSVLAGEAKRLRESKQLKVPHMGWNQLVDLNASCPFLKDVKEGEYVYFCHSYYSAPKDKASRGAGTEYGEVFTSVVWKDNIYGAQFHPEKSQAAGLKMLKNFVELC